MKNIALTILVAASIGTTCSAQQMADCPPACATTAPRSIDLPQTPRGAYVRAPETGEQAGESTGFGLRGFGVRLPAISFDLPEIRMPRLVKYRGLPEMFVDGSRAPWVENRALEFNQVSPRAIDTETPRSIDAPTPRDTCIPPMPCADNKEKKLRDELARKDAEIEKIQSQLTRLEAILERLSESEENVQASRTTRTPRIVEASYTESDVTEAPRKRGAATDATESQARNSSQKSSAPRPSTPVRRAALK